MNTVISIVLFLIILIALYKLYYTLNPDTLARDANLIQLKQSPQLEIDVTELEDPNGIRYFYDGWLMVQEVQSENVNHVVFNRGKDFVVSLKGHLLNIVALNSVANIDKSTGVYTENNINYKIVDIAINLPFQKMVYFCINVDSNQIDVYLNGKLAKSVNGSYIKNSQGVPVDFSKFETSPKICIGSKYLSGGLARFRREPGNIDPPSVWTNYMLGPGLSTDDGNSSNYHAKINITKNKKPRRTYNLF